MQPRSRILAIENEYGLHYDPPREEAHSFGDPDGIEGGCEIDLKRTTDSLAPYGHVKSGFLFNGTRAYIDGQHLEVSTRECTNVSDVTISSHITADAIIGHLVSHSPKLRDYVGMRHDTTLNTEKRDDVSSFGSHENFSVQNCDGYSLFDKLHINDRNNKEHPIIAFLIVRSLLCGAGMIDPLQGITSGSVFHMTQRAFYWGNSIDTAGWFRSFENLHRTNDGFSEFRLHYGGGDTNIYPYTTALKMGLTGLMLDMWQAGTLPHIELANSKHSFAQLSIHNDEHYPLALKGNEKTIPAIDLLEFYLKAAKKYLKSIPKNERNQDHVWALKEALKCTHDLRHRPERLVGKLDRHTKRFILDEFIRDAGVNHNQTITLEDPWIASLAMECERADDKNLLYLLRKKTTKELIQELHQSGLPVGDIDLETAHDLSAPCIGGRPQLRTEVMKQIRQGASEDRFQNNYHFNWDRALHVTVGGDSAILHTWKNPFGERVLGKDLPASNPILHGKTRDIYGGPIIS